jgi:hypothetical protein
LHTHKETTKITAYCRQWSRHFLQSLNTLLVRLDPKPPAPGKSSGFCQNFRRLS